jgi:hypothetical protein
MWHRLKNFSHSLKTYKALSPDWAVRQRVNRALYRRPTLNSDEWFERFYQRQGITYSVAQFVYSRLSHYSGLEFGRVLPTDRLTEDLDWPRVCWFDWDLCLCDDFYGQFQVDISHHLDELHTYTVEELVCLLNRALEI